MKSDESENFSDYGLYEYIDEEKRVKKIYRKNAMSPKHTLDGIFRI